MNRSEKIKGFNRLIALTEHLESKTIAVNKFDFKRYFYTEPQCGTVGCALGCCPTVFSEDWKIKEYNGLLFPCLKSMTAINENSPIDSAVAYFGISKTEANALFMPNRQAPLKLPTLCGEATPKKVAENIRTFVAWKQKQLNLTEQ